MTFLLVQTFLLLLGAFLLGASLACLVRRAFSGRSVNAVPVPASSPGLTGVAAPAAIAEAPLATDRFGRALAGQGPNVPPVFQGPNTGSVVEVQPPPPRSVAVQSPPAAPVPAAEPAPPPVEPPQAPAPPAAPPPVAAPAPAPAEDVPADNAFKPVVGRTYTEIAVAAAAAAAAAKAKADAEEAERAAQAEAASAPPVAEPPAVQGADAGATDESRFGTLVPPAALGASALASREPIDDLTRIRSIDADLKERLHRYGIHTFAAIAAWTPDDVRGVSQTLGFQGRIEQENWIEQARILATGGDANFSRSQAEPVDIAVPVDGERLHRVIGIDPKSEQLLFANGVTRLSQIAAWSDADGAHYEALLGIAAGRILREGWVEQAKFLTRAERGEPDPEPPAEAPPPAGGDGTSHLGLPPKDEPAAAPSEHPARIANKTEIITIASRPSGGEAASSRESLTGLRSVKSEALRGAPVGVNAGEVNDLKRIRGIGVLIEKKLNSLGITGYEQVANWTGADIDRISQLLDFKGRIERENWIEQARILASGGQTEFSRRVDRGEA